MYLRVVGVFCRQGLSRAGCAARIAGCTNPNHTTAGEILQYKFYTGGLRLQKYERTREGLVEKH